MVVWDNLSVMHRATPFENQIYGRTMIRTAIGCREKLISIPSSGPMENFDYIIIGAGSEGCVLANRLSENPSLNILLIEAGCSDKHP